MQASVRFSDLKKRWVALRWPTRTSGFSRTSPLEALAAHLGSRRSCDRSTLSITTKRASNHLRNGTGMRGLCVFDPRQCLLSVSCLDRQRTATYREVEMSSLTATVRLIAATMLLSIGFVLCPQGAANAAKYCAELRGATATGHPDCSFSSHKACRAHVRAGGGGHCYKLRH